MKSRSHARRKSESIKERISLNPKLEEDDRKATEAALQDTVVRDRLEYIWYAVLKCGDCLKNERCDMKHFKSFAQDCKYANSERNMSAALRCFDVQVGDDETVDFYGFIKALFHMGMERYNTDDYTVALSKVMEGFATPWYEQFKAENEHDGTGPDDSLLDIPEIDRLLYIYDGVFDRLFNRYKDRADHANRDLSLDQLKVLDGLVELDEIRYFMQDFGFFPKFVSFVELSKCSQYSCFGKIVVDPTKQGNSRQSQLEARKESTVAAGVPVIDDSVRPDNDEKVSNPLFIATLPPEFQCDEVLLDKPRFMTCFMRLAQSIFHRPEFAKKLPSVPSRVEEMLNQAAPIYDKMFGRTMEQDCDFTEKGPPLLLNENANSSVHPAVGPMSGAFEVAINGGNFCEKRGVFVRFGEGPEAVVVRAKQIQKKRVLVNAPAMKPRDTVVHVKFHHIYKIELVKETCVSVECSNNRWVYSWTDPSQLLTFQQELPSMDLDEKVSAKLLKFFTSVCAINDRYNTKFLYRDKWKKVKELAHLVEKGSEDSNDPFFMERAEYPEGAKDMCLNFKSYLRVVVRTLYSMHGDKWNEELVKLADVSLQQSSKSVPAAPKLEEDDMTQGRRAIELVDRRGCIELDVFLGPVLCGSLSSRPGDVISCCTGGKPEFIRKGHPFLTYEHREINSESIVLAHIRVAQSLPHLLNRLLNGGFDFSCKHYSPSACKPAGRCWEILAERDGAKTRIGALWDYPGNYCNMDWQPAYQDMKHTSVTMTFYSEEKSNDFVHGFLAYSKAKDISHIRTLLAAKGFDLKTKLYKLP